MPPDGHDHERPDEGAGSSTTFAAWDRGAVESRLSALVAANRFTIAVVFPLIGGLLLVGSAAGVVPRPLRFNAALVLFGTAVMRLPLIAGLLPAIDRRGAAGLTALVAFTYAVELLGVTTGVPYGAFEYGVDLGPMLFDAVPLGLPVFYLPLVLNAYLLTLLLGGRYVDAAAVRLGAALGLVLLVDLVLDPAAVALGFWTYGGGVYYGVPWTNYAGWTATGLVSLAVVDWSLDRSAVRSRLAACPFMLDDLVSFTILWAAVNTWAGNAVPVALAGLLAGALLRADRFDVAVPSWL
ncbi:MAG: bisanhydrobacterioruberin hydratase [Halobacteriaceae archaeon]